MAVTLFSCATVFAGNTKTLPAGVYLLGTKKPDVSTKSGIYVMSPDGRQLQALYEVDDGSIGDGRLSRDKRRLAFSFTKSDGTSEMRVLDAQGRIKRISDRAGIITAWSPDGRHIACYRAMQGKLGTFESVNIDLHR